MFEVCGYCVDHGEKKRITIHPVPGYDMPATILCGAKEGKTVLITAGIHAGEYPGIPAVIRTAQVLDPKKISGNIIFIHCVNTSGFWARTDCVLPEDGGNLNADYPGSSDGSITQRIADYFVKEIFPKINFCCDLHSGSQQEPLTPCLFFPKWKAVREESLAAAKSLSIPYLIQSSSKSGEYSYAAGCMNIPGFLLERGHSGFCTEEWIEGYCRDLKLLLSHLGCIESLPIPDIQRHVYTKTIYQEAEEAGVWYCNVESNERVKKGQILGRTEDFFGNVLHEYYAEDDGIVFYHACGLSVKRGRNLVAYGVEEE